jgi:hypothetical protein
LAVARLERMRKVLRGSRDECNAVANVVLAMDVLHVHVSEPGRRALGASRPCDRRGS